MSYLRFFRCFLRGWLGHGNLIRCCLHPSSFGGMLQWQRGQWFAIDSGSAAEIMQTLLSYNDQYNVSMSADCWQSLLYMNYSGPVYTWILLCFPSSSSHFQGPPWAAWPLKILAVWSSELQDSLTQWQCHILEHKGAQQHWCENLKCHLQGVIIEKYVLMVWTWLSWLRIMYSGWFTFALHYQNLLQFRYCTLTSIFTCSCALLM